MFIKMYEYLIVLSIGIAVPAAAIGPGAQDADRYWQVSEEVQGVAKTSNWKSRVPAVGEQKHVQYWRTHTNGDKVEIYDACDKDGQPNAIATKTGDLAWSIRDSKAKNLEATIDPKSQALKVTIDPNKTLWATGHRILKPVCTVGHLPSKVVFYQVPKEGEQTLAATQLVKCTGLKKEECVSQIVDDIPHCAYKNFKCVEAGLPNLVAAIGQTLVTERPVDTLPKLPKVPPPTKTNFYADNTNGDGTVAGTPNAPNAEDDKPVGKIKIMTRNCTTAPLTIPAIKALSDSPALAEIPNIWPGALIQGKGFIEGVYDPIDIKRAGGKITIDGINFAPGSDYMAKVDEMSAGDVKTAISKNLMTQEIAGTETLATFTTSTVHSQDDLAFQLGVDGRYSGVSFNAALKVDSSSKKNYVIARFSQIYYNVAAQPPESMTDVFADRDNFIDPKKSMGADNVPLFVSNVSYGRQIYFLASSEESALNVAAALGGAFGQKEGGGNFIAADAAMSMDQVMAKTDVTYFILGGNAGDTLGELGEWKGSADLFEKIKKIIAAEKLTQVSAGNQGKAVAYTLNYLTSGTTAATGYATSYNQEDCVDVPVGKHRFVLDVLGIDDEVKVTTWLAGKNKVGSPDLDTVPPNDETIRVYQSSYGRSGISLDSFWPKKVQDENWIVRVQLYNIAGYSGLSLRLKHYDPDGNVTIPIPTTKTKWNCRDWNVGWCVDLRFMVNRATGRIEVFQDTNS